MAYPFIQWPTFEHVRERLVDEFDCTYHPNVIQLSGINVGELRRVIDGKVYRYATTYTDDYRLSPSVISGICTQLRVSPQHFGMTLKGPDQ